MRRKMIEDGNLNLHKGMKRTRNDNYGVNKIFKSLEKVIDSLKQKQPRICRLFNIYQQMENV